MPKPNPELFSSSLLIKLIHEPPHLWDATCEDYKLRRKNKNSWSEIAQKLNTDVKSAKEKWKNLRDGYAKIKKKQEQGNISHRPSWKFLDEMQFLEGVIQTKDTTQFKRISFKYENQTDEETNLNEEISQEVGMRLLGLPPCTYKRDFEHEVLTKQIEATSSSVKQATTSVNEVMLAYITKLEESYKSSNESSFSHLQGEKARSPADEVMLAYLNQHTNERQDEEGLFAAQIASTLRRLSPMNKAQTKVKLQTILFEAEQEEYASQKSVNNCKKRKK